MASKYSGLTSAVLVAGLVAGCQSGAPAKPETAAEPPPAVQPAPAEVAPAEEPVRLKPNAPLHYTVKKGDTLWDIANYFLLDPWQWPELWYVNPQVANPHLIYPGDELTLIWVGGRPQLVREGGLNAVHLSPSARAVPLEQAIPAIPLEAIRQFLNGPRVVSLDEIESAPYVVEFTDTHIVGGAGEGIYVKDLPAASAVGYSVVELGGPYRDPDDGDIIGYEALPVGEAALSTPGQPATMQLVKSFREAKVGDRLLPTEEQLLTARFYPHAPAGPVGGRIISVYDGISEIGQYAIVAINRGSKQGLEPGHVLSILQAGRLVKDPYHTGTVQLPDLYAGTLMVFKTTPRLSYGLVMSANRPLHVLDKVEKPVASR